MPANSTATRGFEDGLASKMPILRERSRPGVAISRLTNAVAQGPFEMEIAVAGEFKGMITLENFEVWQLGLLALTIRALNDGLVKVGFGKNRGFGEVTFKVMKATLDLAKTKETIPSTELWGVGAFVDHDEREPYGLNGNDRLTDLPEGEKTDLAVFVRRTYDADAWQKIAEKALQQLPQALGVGS